MGLIFMVGVMDWYFIVFCFCVTLHLTAWACELVSLTLDTVYPYSEESSATGGRAPAHTDHDMSSMPPPPPHAIGEASVV